jgi:hypothetical protein
VGRRYPHRRGRRVSESRCPWSRVKDRSNDDVAIMVPAYHASELRT